MNTSKNTDMQCKVKLSNFLDKNGLFFLISTNFYDIIRLKHLIPS